MMPSSPDFAQKSSPGSPLHFCVSLLPNGQPERSALFPLFHVVPRGGGENADRAPEMDIQAFRTHSAIEWPDWELLCLNSWFPDVFMVFGHTVKAVGKPLKRPKTPKESTLQPFWPLSWRKTLSPNKNAISRGKFQNSFSGKRKMRLTGRLGLCPLADFEQPFGQPPRGCGSELPFSKVAAINPPILNAPRPPLSPQASRFFCLRTQSSCLNTSMS